MLLEELDQAATLFAVSSSRSGEMVADTLSPAEPKLYRSNNRSSGHTAVDFHDGNTSANLRKTIPLNGAETVIDGQP